MIFKFTLLSDEVDQFVRVIAIRDDATFMDFNHAILESVDFDDNLLTSFFLCSDNWEKEKEITLIDMGLDYDDNNCIMGETLLKDLVVKEKQKLLFVFDIVSERLFFIELGEISDDTLQEKYKITAAIGDPPLEELSDEDLFASIGLDDIFSQDDGFEDIFDDIYEEEYDGEYDGEYDDIDSMNFDDSDFY